MPISKLNEADLNKIRAACAFLFSPELAGDNEFIQNLNPASIKKAFRDKAKRYHPDLHSHESSAMLNRRKERFVKIKESYEYLNDHFLSDDVFIIEQGAGRGDIIAVGGAKGGIGKSIFTTNMGVILASLGKESVLIDLDLGGANLHLYLGEVALKGTVNDFLNNHVPTLQDITIQSKYGPHLIGGDSSQLGAANITFTQKLKLLRAIKQIRTDYVILDLGGDTSFNMIDFFLAADHKIIVTTCDPASYLDAYNFLKVALYRKLTRVFGAESNHTGRRDSELEELIRPFTLSKDGLQDRSIHDLLTIVQEQQPWNLSLIEEIIDSYRPYLVVNRVTSQCNVKEVVERIKLVSKKKLSIDVNFLGYLPYQQEIEASVRELVPAVARYPRGVLANKTRQIVHSLLKD